MVGEVRSEDAERPQYAPGLDGSLLGNWLVRGLGAQWHAWPEGKRPDDSHQPLASDVPALLLSGELDPATPPAYAERVVKTLPNGRSLVLRGQGHNVNGAACMPKLFAQLLATANARGLYVACLDKLAYTQTDQKSVADGKSMAAENSLVDVADKKKKHKKK